MPMRLVEIRDLDGPNVFLLKPAIKIELALDGAPIETVKAIEPVICDLHRQAGAAIPDVITTPIETPDHAVIAFSWQHRRLALAVAEVAARIVTGESADVDTIAERLREIWATHEDDDAPLLVRDAERTTRAIAVTGTNGKTTTTRLIAHVARVAGWRVGWCSSTGVYIDGTEVLQGDYSGPSGARRVLTEPGLDLAVLETARGGILLRGLAYESNDVSVFTNVSGDHLGHLGVHTVEGLARVKSVVVRVTRPEGFAVLNADDPLVLAQRDVIRARPFLISQDAGNPAIAAHVAGGGHALVVSSGNLVLLHGGTRTVLMPVTDVPITFGGRARPMIENALCGAAACVAIGLDSDAVRRGLGSFRNSTDQNLGRLNVFRVGDVTVIVDFAHNEAGLSSLIDFARTLVRPNGRLIAIIGTAGDRTDASLRAIGRIAAERSDVVIVKGTRKYLRGREPQELIELYLQGVRSAGAEPYAIEPLELPALLRALDMARPGDVVAVMAHEQVEEIVAHLQPIGEPAEAGAG
jgi:cyanophycin synthetase